MKWKKYNSIAALPEGLWEEKIARGDAAMDARLWRVAERMCTDTAFEYWLGLQDDKPVALLAWTIRTGVASTGTPETSGLPLWFDGSRVDRAAFLSQVLTEAGQGSRLVFQDFIGAVADEWQTAFEAVGFQARRVLDLSLLAIPPQVHSLDEYPTVLNAKHRYRWNQYRAAIDRERYAVEAVTDYLPLLDRLYPLYVEVSQRAREYRAEAWPEAYFRVVKEEFGDDATVMTIRERATDEYLGFMLLLYTATSCVHQYIGFERRDELFLWHNLVIESIGDALHRNVRRINMGVTHAEAKHKFGAITQPVFFFASLI
ncbi:MAG: hypothetical protein LBM20_02120 [Rikenellaceae bacterium]|jgi:hypothetical protein|nr:hypothetical protein [Rikenellaceae bacterium]